MGATVAAKQTKSRVRKVAISRECLNILAGQLAELSEEIEQQAEGLKKAALKIDGARTPERALKMLRLFKLKIETAIVAAE